MLDELLLGGEIQETSKKNVLKAIAAQDLLQEVCKISICIMTHKSQFSIVRLGKKILNISPIVPHYTMVYDVLLHFPSKGNEAKCDSHKPLCIIYYLQKHALFLHEQVISMVIRSFSQGKTKFVV